MLGRHAGSAELPLGRGLTPGCRLAYGIRAHGQDLGVVSWVAAPLRLAPRDELPGWDERTRRHSSVQLSSKGRFLIRNGVQVRNLARRVLAQALQILPQDCKERYGAVPVAVETCVGQLHEGTYYKAAGFEQAGETAGCPWGVKRPKWRKQPQEARPAPQSEPRPAAKPSRPVWVGSKTALPAQPPRSTGPCPPCKRTGC